MKICHLESVMESYIPYQFFSTKHFKKILLFFNNHFCIYWSKDKTFISIFHFLTFQNIHFALQHKTQMNHGLYCDAQS
jgi:hypothetical protein